MMPKKRQALVEYEDMNGSCNAVSYAAENQVYIAGHPAFINYSTSQKISRPGDSDDNRSINNVLLFTILNPIYPITTVRWFQIIKQHEGNHLYKLCVKLEYYCIITNSNWIIISILNAVVFNMMCEQRFKVTS